jgi:hypothetical protein
MQEFTPLDPPERDLEQSLKSLSLEAGKMEEQEIWYRAGLLASRRRINFWRGVAAAVVVLASTAALLRPRPATVTIERFVYLPRSSADVAVAQAATAAPSLPSAYLVLRNAVETDGWRALAPEQRAGVSTPAGQSLTPRPIDESVPTFWESTPNRG